MIQDLVVSVSMGVIFVCCLIRCVLPNILKVDKKCSDSKSEKLKLVNKFSSDCPLDSDLYTDS